VKGEVNKADVTVDRCGVDDRIEDIDGKKVPGVLTPFAGVVAVESNEVNVIYRYYN